VKSGNNNLPHEKPRLAVMTNIVAPYRLPIYERLGEAFETIILRSGDEGNRTTWADVPRRMANCRLRRSWGLTLRRPRRDGETVFDHRYLHINPGYFFDLVRERPQAVISSELGFRTLAALCYTKLFRKPLWVWWGGTLHTERRVPRWKSRLRRRIARRVPRWISYGAGSTRYLHTLGVADERILQIQNCVDEAGFDATAAAALDVSPRPVILCVGQLVARKGVDALLQASARVQAAGHSFSLLIVGDGPEEENLRRLAEKLRLVNVHFHASRKPEAMAGVYRSADVLVFPTRQDVWGLVANEAILCGIPVLCSIYAGCAEELIPRENRFDPDDPARFEEVLTRAASGRVAAADRGRLLNSGDVAQRIVDDVRRTLSIRSQHQPGNRKAAAGGAGANVLSG
jgi:glycosyltransferase involved in cell wall biosynthesis